MLNSSNNASPAWSKTDVVLKILLPIVTVILAALTVYFNFMRDFDQSHDKKTELQQKESDLFNKQSDLQRAKDAAKADFLQKNLPLLTSSQAGAMRQIDALIEATFTRPEDAFDIKQKALHIHESAVEPHPQMPTDSAQFKALGFQYVSGGYFAEAALSFSSAVNLSPNDIQAWNALAYSQFRLGDHEEAMKSISRAIDLKPSERGLSRLVIINAVKILCAQGKTDGARTYLNVAIGMNPEIVSEVKKDGELLRICEFQMK